MAEEQLYVGGDSDTDDDIILEGLGYTPTADYQITKKRDGHSGGGGEDCCYVVVERKPAGFMTKYDEGDDDERTDI